MPVRGEIQSNAKALKHKLNSRSPIKICYNGCIKNINDGTPTWWSKITDSRKCDVKATAVSTESEPEQITN